MTDKTTTRELDDAALDAVGGGAQSQNNLKQLGLAALDPASAPGGINVLLADGSVRGVSTGVNR